MPSFSPARADAYAMAAHQLDRASHVLAVRESGAVLPAEVAVVGRVDRSGAPPRSLVIDTVGTVAIAHASVLVGLVRGRHRPIGACVVDGKRVTFDLWFPHVGIAVDFPAADRATSAAKRAWCETHFVAYIGPDDWNADTLSTLATFARTRREGTLACN